MHLDRHLEVRAIRDVDGRLNGSALHARLPFGSANGNVQVQRVGLQHLREERIACGRVLRVDLRQPGKRRQQLLCGLDLGRLVAGDDLNEAHRVVIDVGDRRLAFVGLRVHDEQRATARASAHEGEQSHPQAEEAWRAASNIGSIRRG